MGSIQKKIFKPKEIIPGCPDVVLGIDKSFKTITIILEELKNMFKEFKT